MGKETGISWTDHTFNPWWGCTKVSPGCDICYAETYDRARGGGVAHWGKGAPRRTFGERHWNQPRLWDKAARLAGRVERVFSASMADVMDDEAPEGELQRLWKLIDETPNLTWQLLTKRPHRYAKRLPEEGFKYGNVMLGTTVERQEFCVPRIEALIKGANALYDANIEFRERGTHIPLFISYEPALGPLYLGKYASIIDWLIFGGETGAGRREMQEQWARDIQGECEANGIAFFMKQMSAATPTAAAALIPIDLLIREFPEVERG